MEMEPAKIANQMISFQKNLFENAFGAMSRDNFKKSVDDGFAKMEEMFNRK